MSNEADEFEKMLIDEGMKKVENITKDAEKLLKKNVNNLVYKSFNPKTYIRTNQLKNSLTSKVDGVEGTVFFDSDKLNHTSVVSSENVGKFTPKWVDKGHHSPGADNMFNNYNGRDFIELMIKELEEKYGKNCVERTDTK